VLQALDLRTPPVKRSVRFLVNGWQPRSAVGKTTTRETLKIMSKMRQATMYPFAIYKIERSLLLAFLEITMTAGRELSCFRRFIILLLSLIFLPVSHDHKYKSSLHMWLVACFSSDPIHSFLLVTSYVEMCETG